MKKVSKKFEKMCVLYKHFSLDLDFSADAKLELYLQESFGIGFTNPRNGFALGKQQLNLNVTMWLEDLKKGTLFKFELYEDSLYPDWWLDKILHKKKQGLNCFAVQELHKRQP